VFNFRLSCSLAHRVKDASGKSCILESAGDRSPGKNHEEELKMNTMRRRLMGLALSATALASIGFAHTAYADSREQLTADGERALHKLEMEEPKASSLARRAKAVLVFPSVLKAGFVFGGETGNGVLLVNGHADGYYNLTGGSWGLQLGGQDFSYALFFMTDSALDYLRKSEGFSAGTGPSIVVVNKGAGAEADTTNLRKDVYAFPFNQKGLMADLTLQGTKISHIHPK
jgi:lipid-binding SYLF domain-containing protein